ncbi:VWA domain-containing protein [Streptomyces sp. NPDC050759]|uniref:VWA domain-containing protein n=1 Tax=Streptomyces sp. NPDC050759 TaxID=3365635 RepID=UPI0037A3DD4B
MLAFPGVSRYPLESGMVADVAHRAASMAAFLSETSEVEAWVYTSRAHRLPSFTPAEASEWVGEWAVLPKKPLFTQDAAPGNSLARHERQFGLGDGEEDVAAAVRDIAQSVSGEGVPTLVLFYLWATHDKGPTLGDRLRETADDNVFWQFLSENSPGDDVQTLLKRLPGEAPDIRNVHLYTGWEQLDDTPHYFFCRGVLKPFMRWRRLRS